MHPNRSGIRILCLAALALLSSVVPTVAQTNTFPDSGNVGIGTTSPLFKLDVLGSARLQNNGTGGVYAGIGIRSTNRAELHLFANGDNACDLQFGRNERVDGNVLWGLSTRMSSDGNKFFLYEGPMLAGNWQPRIAVVPGGNVGIGTTNPLARLVVAAQHTAPANVVVGEFSKHGSSYEGGFGSTILRVSRTFESQSADLEVNSAGGGPFRYGTYGDAILANNQNNTNGPYGSVHFVTNAAPRLTIGGGTLAGNVGIGTTSPSHKLSVNGTIKAKEVIVETTGWSDYVFADDYRLAPLSEVEAHIKTERRLPGIPSEQQVVEKGVSVGEMQAALLAKIEELTLHQIEQEKRHEQLRAEVESLRMENAALRQPFGAITSEKLSNP